MTMALSITCDDCGLTVECSTDHDSGCNEIDGVLEDGWVHESSEDLCPQCARKVSRIVT